MFILSGLDNKKMKEVWNTHRLGVVGLNIYYHNIRALKQRTFQFITQETYDSYFAGILHDINLESSPVDTIIPNDSPDEQAAYQSLFSVNTEIPEYDRVRKRITLDDIYQTLPETNDTRVKMTEHPEALPNLVDEIFVYFVIENYKYFIDEGHLEMLSNMKETLEWVADNVDEKTIKSFIHTTKINYKKLNEKLKNATFFPEYKRTKIFYEEPHGDIPAIDIETLLGLLFTNCDTETDMVIVTAIYMILSYAMPDIDNANVVPTTDMRHVNYIKNVISKFIKK